MADKPTGAQKAKSEPKLITEDQIKSLSTGIVDAVYEKHGEAIAAKALDTIRRETTPGALTGTENTAGVQSPAYFIKTLPFNPYEQYTDNFKGLAFARGCRMKAAVKLLNSTPDAVGDLFAKAIGGNLGSSVKTMISFKDGMKAVSMTESDMASGGALVQTAYGEFIGLLRAATIVRGSGVMSAPMPQGNLTMRRQTAPGLGYYQGESRPIATSKQSYGLDQISVKKLMAETILSNDLIRDAGPQADVLTREDLLLVCGQREDIAFIRSNGLAATGDTGATPKGVRYRVASGNVFAISGSTLAAVTADLEKCRTKLRAANVPLDRLAWYISPRSEGFLRTLRDGNGNLVYKPEMDQGKLNGSPYFCTTQIPENLGGGGNESEIYLVAVPHLRIYDSLDIEVNTFPGGAYNDGTSVVSGISNDETVIQTIARHDFFQRYDVAAAVITGVTWA